MKRRAGSLVFAVVLIALGGGAWAGGTEESEIRTITATSATSDCIGDPRTPICAVETLLGCFGRQDRSLCDKVTRQKIEYGGEQFDHRYRILSVRIIREKDISPELRDTDWMRPGNAQVTIRDLDFIQSQCPKGCRIYFYLRPVSTGWEALSWGGEGVD